MANFQNAHGMTVYHVTTNETALFIMDAPLHIIASVFRFHKSAVERIKQEAKSDCVGCLVFANRHDPFPQFGPAYRIFKK